ncbi:MAG: CoB--CoM heterodisulfide reductase iron-sulfur subunit B family protein [Anaerolineales bacterium]|nr:CoB--CoM heterodisulfide reductase iron-sulfur subunit B family protein [Anaerolineales bacterium]
MDFTYYPGCSLSSTACEYDDSVRAVFEALGVGLHELEDWNCCGASSAHSLNHALSLALPSRNLALAQKAGRDLAMPCAACFNRHKAADHVLRSDPQQRAFLEEVVDFTFTGAVAVRPLLDVIGNQVGLEQVAARVTRPLKGLKVVGYYGCLLVRPPEVTGFENPDNPTLMNRLLSALGAEARPWSYATECCGGGLSLTKSSLAARMVSRLAGWAREAGAEAIVTSCPLCQVNLEMRQDGKTPKLPIFYFSELIGLAFGLEKARSWWGKHLVNPLPLLQTLALAG